MINIDYRNGLYIPQNKLLENNDTGFVIQNIKTALNPNLDKRVLVTFNKLAEGLDAINRLNSLRIPYVYNPTGNTIIFKTVINCRKNNYNFSYNFDRKYRLETYDNQKNIYIPINPNELYRRIINLYKKFIVCLAMNLSKDFGETPFMHPISITDLDFSCDEIERCVQVVYVNRLNYIPIDGESIDEDFDEFIDKLFYDILSNNVYIGNIKYFINGMSIDI